MSLAIDTKLPSTIISLEITRDLIRFNDILEKSRVPDEILRNSPTLIRIIEEKINEYKIKTQNAKLDKFRTVVWRSYDAVNNTLKYMNQQGYKSGIMVIGINHLPSVSWALYRNGYRKMQMQK